jgi:cytidylate kinase
VIVTIDGPAGAGKSSIARQVAERLGFEFLDTGALYRAVTLGAIRDRIDLNDPDALIQFSRSVQLQWKTNRVLLNGNDVSDEIRAPTVTDAIRFVADLPDVRIQLSKLQRQIAQGRDIVTEGRDQGTEVFPDATCKIFLTAAPEERARRRQQQLADAGRFLSIDEIRKAQDLRDAQDCDRPLGGLSPADDSLVITSDGMTPDQVINQIVLVVESRR